VTSSTSTAAAKASVVNPSSFAEFDIEYAKLIAKQFPIYDQNGALIDYCNINEYQLDLLALHEEYGEQKDPKIKMEIFIKLKSMKEEDYYRDKNKDNNSKINPFGKDKKKDKMGDRKYGPHVGKDGGNPNYRKNVIQLEQERIEREKQELLMKRKRNSNYI